MCSAKRRIFNSRPSLFIRNKPIFSSERMLHKDYYRKSSVGKKFLDVGHTSLAPRRTDWRQTVSRKVILTLILTSTLILNSQLSVGDSHGKSVAEEELEVSLWRRSVWLEVLVIVMLFNFVTRLRLMETENLSACVTVNCKLCKSAIVLYCL
jgi:hypothetical protein